MKIGILILALCLLGGCSPHIRAPADMSLAKQAQDATERAETADAKVRRIEGELTQAKLERDDERLAGARRLLNWSTGILALLAIGGVVAAIFMRSKLIGIAAASCAGGAAACQVLNRALDHLELISWLTLAAAVIIGGMMVWRYHRD